MPVKLILRPEPQLAALAASFVGLLWLAGWLPALERPVGDLLLRLPRPAAGPQTAIAAVMIDDGSVAELGALPWPRERFAALVQGIRQSGARAVVLDLLLSEAADPESDQALEAALSGFPAALAAVLDPYGRWLLPLDRFGGRTSAAHAHAETSSDGVVRAVAVSKQNQRLALPALSIAAARLSGWSGAIAAGEVIRPDFRIPPHQIPRVSAAALLTRGDESGRLRDCVVFVGLSAAGAGDQFLVPVGPRNRPVAGALIHASAASAVVSGGLLTLSPWWISALCALAIAFLVQIQRTRAGRLAPRSMAIAAAVCIAVPLAALWSAGVQLPTVSFLSSAAFSIAFREALESRTAQRETRTVLSSLLDTEVQREGEELPPGVGGQLRLAYLLQTQLIRDRDLRRTLLEGLGEGVILWDDSGTPVMSNGAVQKLWGHPPRLDEVMQAAEIEDASGTGSVEAELTHAGRRLELRLRALDEGHLALLSDLSDRQELERQRREMQRLVSHQLKTPLASIAGFGSMLERYSLSESELRHIAGTIRTEAERLGEMVRRFLDLERLATDHWNDERTAVALSELVEQRCEVLAQGAQGKARKIDVRGDSNARVIGVPQLLVELVDNLVSNALKYSTDDAPVTVSVTTANGEVALSVADLGPGIPEDAIPRLFERFFRVPGTDVAGTGLGLALVKEVAEWHEAQIQVESELGHGTTFELRFPAADENREE